MSGVIRWHRKAGKPTQYANTEFPRDALGQRAKAAYAAWRASLTPKQQRSLSNRPARR